MPPAILTSIMIELSICELSCSLLRQRQTVLLNPNQAGDRYAVSHQRWMSPETLHCGPVVERL